MDQCPSASHKMHDAAYLLCQIANGRTLYISTYGHVTKITQRDVVKFAKANLDLLTNDDKGNLYSRSGKSRVDISYAALELR